MRTLCLKFASNIDSNLAEVFLIFTPKVQYRPPHWVFLDISDTSHLFGGEKECLHQVRDKALLFEEAGLVQTAIADHPYVAQVLCEHHASFISPRGQDQETIKSFSTQSLFSLEGLVPWKNKNQIQSIIDFFQRLGILSCEELQKFPSTSFKERWGSVGETLYRRLFCKEHQPISLLITQEGFYSYHYFDDPASLTNQILHPFYILTSQLFARLEGRGRFAQKIQITLYFEYSQKSTKITLEPISSSRDLTLFYDLFKNKLEQISLENPIREFEIDLIDVPEKIIQLDFFEPRDHSQEKWQRLLSFAKDHECEVGFLKSIPEILPEKSLSFAKSVSAPESITDEKNYQENALQVKTALSKNLAMAPRPSLLLEQPEVLDNFHQLKFLTRLPTERFETSWWQLTEKEKVCRDYYFALNPQGQLLWVFQDRMSEKYYLHGYFD